MTVILGINAYHGDSSAALVVDGKLVNAIEEERFNRIKHWAGFPAESVRWCLADAGVSPGDVDHVAVSFNPRAHRMRRVAYVVKQRPSLRSVVDRLRRQSKAGSIIGDVERALNVSTGTMSARFHAVEHHSAHVAAGFLISPFEKAAILSIDGMGDFTSTLTAYGEGSQWNELSRVWYPHSLGFMYSAVTMHLGFLNYGDEYKVMGLAPYGAPEYVNEIRKLVRLTRDGFELDLDYFTHHKAGIQMSWQNGSPSVAPFAAPALARLVGPARAPLEQVTRQHENIARSLQVVCEEVIVHLLKRLFEKTGCENVCLSGGVAMNSVANGKVTRATPFKHVYIPAGAADNGTSFGAAFDVWHRVLGNQRSFVQDHAYWGYHATEEECISAVRSVGIPIRRFEEDRLLEWAVEQLMAGKVIGWFQGRMEFGARALGSRSLIADPRRADMRDIINLRIKFREKFRPFAPSILEEHVHEWFESADHTPYMEKVYPVRPEKRSMVPAITHVDGSGRLQSVSRFTNPLYHSLISRFYEATGVPILLNTSLNENEPVVRTPSEALSCFLRTDMDALALGSVVVDRDDVSFPEQFRRRLSLAPGELPIR